MQRQIDVSLRAEWERALEGIPHGFAHSWWHCRAFAASSSLATFLYVDEDGAQRVVCPLSARTFEGRADLVTPYGFGGFAGSCDDPAFAARWSEWARSSGFVCGYLALNPLFMPQCLEAAPSEHATDFYVLDLMRSIDELKAALHKGRRGQLRLRETGGFEPIVDRQILRRFVLAHQRQFFASRTSAAIYRFSDETFDLLFESPSLWAVGAGREDCEAVALFGSTPWCADYLFNLSIDDGRAHSFDLVWEAVLHFKAAGVRYLNLGGGIRPNDDLARFKARFGATPMPMRVLKEVYDRATFDALCERAGVSPQSGYFPPYHAVAR